MERLHRHRRGVRLNHLQTLFGNCCGKPPASTRDIDSLISRKVPKIAEKSIAEYLAESGYRQCMNLHIWLDTATPSDWIYLESQDPYGILNADSFKDIVQGMVDKGIQ